MHEGLSDFPKEVKNSDCEACMHACSTGKRGVVKSPVRVRWKGDDEWGVVPGRAYGQIWGRHWAAHLVQPAHSDQRNGVQMLANE